MLNVKCVSLTTCHMSAFACMLFATTVYMLESSYVKLIKSLVDRVSCCSSRSCRRLAGCECVCDGLRLEDCSLQSASALACFIALTLIPSWPEFFASICMCVCLSQSMWRVKVFVFGAIVLMVLLKGEHPQAEMFKQYLNTIRMLAKWTIDTQLSVVAYRKSLPLI